MARWSIHGYAVISDEGNIADAFGQFPVGLQHDADWAYFQGELDRCAATVLGRKSHEAAPNARRRLRVVVSGKFAGLTRHDSAWWWNPASVSITDMLSEVVPGGGRIAVPGGRAVFDLFLGHGFDAFHLTRHQGVKLAGGVPLFSSVTTNASPEQVLRASGLEPGSSQTLAESVNLTVWTPK